MAYNEVSLPQWQQLIRRVFGLTGPGGNVPVVAPEIQPVVILQPSNSEFRRLRAEKMWSFGRNNESGVGTFGTIGLVNPATSNIVVVVERAFLGFQSGTANAEAILVIDTQANVEGSTASVVGVTGFATRDSREITPGAGQSGATLRFGTPAAPSVGFKLTGIRASTVALVGPTFAPEVQEIVLFPGFGIMWNANQSGVGHIVYAYAQWYERPLESAEATG